MEPREVHCGRIDDHDPHPWSRPATLFELMYGYPKRLHFTCPGPPEIEGGAR